MTNCLKLNRLVALSKAWSISEVLWILKVYKCDYDELCWRSFWTTPHAVGVATDGNYPASELRVKFLGGPTGSVGYTGSLSMYTVDRILANWKLNKTNWSWLLQFNSDTTTHISEQLGQVAPGTRQQSLPGFSNDAGHYEGAIWQPAVGNPRSYFGDERDGHSEEPPFNTHTKYMQMGRMLTL